jgi:hypothetical protein
MRCPRLLRVRVAKGVFGWAGLVPFSEVVIETPGDSFDNATVVRRKPVETLDDADARSAVAGYGYVNERNEIRPCEGLPRDCEVLGPGWDSDRTTADKR